MSVQQGRGVSLKYTLISGLPDQDDKQPPPKLINLCNSPNGIKELSTSSEALTNNMNEEEDTVSTVKHPYIIKNNNTIEDDIADEVIDEAMVDNAFDFNTI